MADMSMTNRASHPRWHRLYFALAAFDLITVSFSLYINHRLMQVYSNSVDENHVWADRLTRYSEIALLAAEVNAPGNDVFQTLDVDEASGRLARVQAQFDQELRDARDDVRQNVPADLGAALLDGLENVKVAMQAMVGDAQSIFSYFRENERSKAGPRMAIMDKNYYGVIVAAAALVSRVQAIQETRFAEQTAVAGSMRKLEYVIAGFIVLMVLGVTAYGNKMSREVRQNHARSEEMIRALQESEGRLRSIFDMAADGIAIMNQEGKLESFNAAAERITGWKAAEVIGKSVGIFATPPHAKEHDDYVARYLKTGQARIIGFGREEICKRKDGTTFPLYLAVSEVRLGDRRLFTGIMRDLTELKKAEETVRRHSEILEQTVRERTAELASAKDKAEESNRAKSLFLANMSHELRTPLHGILSFAGFGIKRHASVDREKILGYFEMIEQSGKTLLVLLNDLLDLSKLESGVMTFELQPADLCKLTESVVAEFDALASERRVKIRFAHPGFKAMSDVDLEKIKQVIRNLLSNAVKFSPQGGLVEIGIERGDGMLVFSLCDQGPGIPEGELETVFDKFVQSSKTQTGAGGTGLGLAICRQIVSGHDGRIWAENNPEKGARFQFQLIQLIQNGEERPPFVMDLQDGRERE